MPEAEVGQTHELDRGWLDEFVTRWESAWNSHEPARLLDLMTEDVVYKDSAWPTTMRGHADVRAFLDHAWRAFPDLRFEAIDGPYVVSAEPKAAFYWKGTGTNTGPIDPPGFAPTGNRLEFEGADFFEYRDGRVCHLRIVFDMVDVGQQLGTLPKAGSPLEKAGAAVQRLEVMARERLRGMGAG